MLLTLGLNEYDFPLETVRKANARPASRGSASGGRWDEGEAAFASCPIPMTEADEVPHRTQPRIPVVTGRDDDIRPDLGAT
ncbi:MAG: hypothetical protein DI537_60010 [Stutzerimonas stutzeri]|nr:MAG: hypothetical protein DI537_60010 [Stutzerimonas stutzeri]